MKITRIIKSVAGNKLLVQGLTDTNFYFLANLGSKLISFLIIPLITRMVGIEDFATYDLFILSCGILSMITGIGMDSGSAILIIENKDKPSNLKKVFSITIFSNLFILLLLWLLATACSHYFTIPYLAPLIIHYIFIYTLFNQINYNIFNFIRWFGESRRAAFLNLFTSVTGTILAFTLLNLQKEKTIDVFLLGLVSGAGIGALISIYMGRMFFTIKKILEKTLLRQLLHLSIPYVPTYLGNYLMQIADRLIVTYFFGTYALGLYALCNRVAQIPNLLLQIIAKGFQPILLGNYENPQGQKLNRQFFSFFWIATIPVNLVLTALAGPLVLLFGGPKYSAAAPIIPLMVNSSIFFGAFFLFGFSYSIRRKTAYVTIITFMTLLSVYGFSLLTVSVLGFMAIAFATFISSVLGAIVYIYISEKLYPFHYRLSIMWLAIIANCCILLLYYSFF